MYDYETVRAALVAEAEHTHAQYPQYRNHWDGYGLASITRRSKTKFGVAFEAGDIVLARPENNPADPYGGRESITCYSFRNGIDTSVLVRNVRRLDAADFPVARVSTR